MSFHELKQVHASRDIRRFRTTLVTRGAPGRIVSICPGRTDPRYNRRVLTAGRPGSHHCAGRPERP